MYGPSFGSFLLPYSGDYKMAVYNAAGYGDHGFVAGNFNILFDIVEYPGPVIGLQEPIPFEFTAGAQSASLIGENEDDHVARYAFTASAGQELHLSFFQDPTLGVWIEDAEGNQLIHTVGRVNSSLLLPETGEYTVSIYRGGSEGYRGGPYEVFLFLIDG